MKLVLVSVSQELINKLCFLRTLMMMALTGDMSLMNLSQTLSGTCDITKDVTLIWPLGV